MSLGTATPGGGDHDDDDDDDGYGRDDHDDEGSHGERGSRDDDDDHGSGDDDRGERNLSSLFDWLTREVLGRLDSVPGAGGRERSDRDDDERDDRSSSLQTSARGSDTIVVQHSGAGNDTITFGRGLDTVRGLGSATAPGGRGWANVEAQSDTRQSGRNTDSVFAGSGDSTLIAGNREPSFLGDRLASLRSDSHGDDTIVGGSGLRETDGIASRSAQSTFTFDTQQAGGTHLFSSFAQSPSPVDSGYQDARGAFTVSGGHTTTSAQGTVITLDERTTLRITNNSNH